MVLVPYTHNDRRDNIQAYDPIERNWATIIKEQAIKLISGQQTPGKILVTTVVVLSLASLVIYFYDVTTQPIESCQNWSENVTQQIDLAFNFVAAQDKLKFWCLDIHSFVDYFTIPPSFTAIVLGRNWIGMRFVRIARIMNIPEILQFLHILKSSNSIRLSRMFCLVLTVWFSAAGFVHLVSTSIYYYINLWSRSRSPFYRILKVENSGDFFQNYSNSQTISYFQCVYFLIVTLSAIPELAEMFSSKKKYGGEYRCEYGKKFVVVCGHITFTSVENFLKDFLHEDRINSDEFYDSDVLIADKKRTVDFEFQALLKRHFTRVKYFDATVMDPVDLERIKIKRSETILILANKDASDPDGEDASNIMRVISIKNYHPDAKIIVQLLQYHNKMHLMNISSWNNSIDEAVCIAELKLGLIAESCLNPGFSTMIANIFAMRSYNEQTAVERPEWLQQYLRGASLEMYTETLSDYFVQDLRNFSEAAKFCFVELNILLFAIEVCEENGTRRLAINPDSTSKYYRIAKRTRGFFLAGSSEEASRARYYCQFCHCNKPPESVRKCLHYRTELTSFAALKPRREISTQRSESFAGLPLSNLSLEFCFDTTGMFYWCPTQEIEQQTINIRMKCELSNHVICCIFAEENSPVIGLRNFVMPLRASNFEEHELKPIVFVGSSVFLKKEWRHICNFPKLYIVEGSPNDRATLRAVNIQLCDMCVILSSPQPQRDYDMKSTHDRYLTDKSAILCSLNIKAMSFEENLSLKKIKEPNMNGKVRENDSNVVFLDQDDEDDPNIELYMTQPFACGTSFAISVLDSLMSATYFNENALTILRALITGGATPELERILAEGAGMTQGTNSKEVLNNRRRPRVVLVSASDIVQQEKRKTSNATIFSNTFWTENPTYGELFVNVLLQKDWLCLGLYRYRDDITSVSESNYTLSPKRYVICSPAKNFPLLQSDLVYMIQQFLPKCDTDSSPFVSTISHSESVDSSHPKASFASGLQHIIQTPMNVSTNSNIPSDSKSSPITQDIFKLNSEAQEQLTSSVDKVNLVIHVRQATANDATELSSIAETIFREIYSTSVTQENMTIHLAKNFSPTIQLAEILNPMIRTLIAYVDGITESIIGFIQIQNSSPPSCVKELLSSGSIPLEIMRFNVISNYRGKGVAQYLMHKCLTQVEFTSQALWFSISTNDSNRRALKFFKKYDFRIVGNCQIRIGRETKEELIMFRTN
ncbi:unnamed protein product [Didymodactylos carnosus]|uniref:BK channel n=1 Tax=Didymodactylos carnosus TaxID=1234261 RepID=A0A8S2CQA9_9BILA|nr:unnamed protein product [Didymodactylos carnosus]CAF3494040.1 unnamed protein product [Didymodactylos carnosus]